MLAHTCVVVHTFQRRCKLFYLHQKYVSLLTLYNPPIFQMIRMSQRSAMPSLESEFLLSNPLPWPYTTLPVKAPIYKLIKLICSLGNKAIVIGFFFFFHRVFLKEKTDYFCIRNWLWKHTHTRIYRT